MSRGAQGGVKETKANTHNALLVVVQMYGECPGEPREE